MRGDGRIRKFLMDLQFSRLASQARHDRAIIYTGTGRARPPRITHWGKCNGCWRWHFTDVECLNYIEHNAATPYPDFWVSRFVNTVGFSAQAPFVIFEAVPDEQLRDTRRFLASIEQEFFQRRIKRRQSLFANEVYDE